VQPSRTIPSEFEGIGKLSDPTGLGMNDIGYRDKMLRVSVSYAAGHFPLFRRFRTEMVRALFDCQESIIIQSHEEISSFIFADIQSLGHGARIPRPAGISMQKEKRFEMGY
jgi:hypothetical protein